MTNDFINRILGIKEAYQMPERMMQILENEEQRRIIFDTFLQEEPNLSYDWFTDYYQSEHGDRDKLKQDFTPDSVNRIINGLLGEFQSIADICAGTGGLTIAAWKNNPDAFFHCEEVSMRAIPVLLFNMAIRGMSGEVIKCDVLTGQISAAYSLKSERRYSRIEKMETPQKYQYDCVIMNPPYSISWSGVPDARFERYGVPPKSKADYAFVLHGLSLMRDTGKLFAILPHGVLFRGQGEMVIRKNLIKDNLIRTIIGLPDNLFLNTGIPVCIMELGKTRDGLYFIDASREFKKIKSRNIMQDNHVEMVLNACRMRRKIDKFSYLADNDEIKKNEFNLNIPRYVDTYEPDELPDVAELFQEMKQLEKEIAQTEYEFLTMMHELVGTDTESEQQIRKEEKAFTEYIEGKNGQLEMNLW